MRPNIARVGGDEKRQVADQTETLGTRAALQPLGLAEYQELRKARQADSIGKFETSPLQCRRFALDQIIGPLRVRSVVKLCLQRPEEGVILQPMTLISAELLVGGTKVSASASFEVTPSFFEQ